MNFVLGTSKVKSRLKRLPSRYRSGIPRPSVYPTNYKVLIYKEYGTTVYVPTSELRVSLPLSRQRVCPSPWNRGGGDTLSCGLRVRGGGVPIPTTGEKA
jgi:hypothetical protein